MKAIKVIILLTCIVPEISALSNIGDYSFLIKHRIKLPAELQKDTAMVNKLVNTGIYYLNSKKDLAGIKACIDTALYICEKKDLEIPALLHLLYAHYYFEDGNYKFASEEAVKAMKKADSDGDSKTLARTMIFLAKYNLKIGFFDESMNYSNSAISLAEKKNLKGIKTKAYLRLFELYQTVGDIPAYQKNLRKMIDACAEEPDSSGLMEGYRLLGHSYLEDNRQPNLADSILRRCIDVSLALGTTWYVAHCMGDIGWNFYLEKNYDSSLYYYNKSILFCNIDKKGDYGVLANSLGNIGTIYRDLGKPAKAFPFYQKSIKYAYEYNDRHCLSWVYHDMSDLYLMQKDTSNAYKTYVLYKQYNDSLIIYQNIAGITESRIRWDAETHRKEVELLSLKLKNNRLLNFGLVGFVVLGITIALLLMRSMRLKAKRRIAEMNRQISEITQANLRQQMNPHFIFNTLNSIQYYMYQHDKLATNNYLTKFSNLMRKVLENSQFTSIPLKDELHALNLYLELESIRFKDKFEYTIRIDDEIDPLIYKIPTMLIQPFVENSICHGLMAKDSKGFIKIDLKPYNNHLLCVVEDNGIGREAAAVKQAKNEDNHNSLGTHIVSSRLDLVNSLYGSDLKTVYTDLKNEKGEPAGTRVEIYIPIII